ncbi:MAG TPA: hypothetical protein VLW17_15645 [Thermoanaerobaculaceae bacterium]|nr:hypothetical protein [Thermoanaerobaculaceae bacterium]
MRRWGAVLIVGALVAAGGARPLAAGAPMSREQLVRLASQGVDASVLASLVARDCVDFDVNAGNVAELSKLLPKEVVKAALDCRAQPAPTAPAVAPPIAPAPAAKGEAGREFGPALEVCESAGMGDFAVDHGAKKTCYGTLTADDAGVSFVTAHCRKHADGDDFEVGWGALARIIVRPGEKSYALEFEDAKGASHRLVLDPSVPWADPMWSDTYDKRRKDCQAAVQRFLDRVREREPRVQVAVGRP